MPTLAPAAALLTAALLTAGAGSATAAAPSTAPPVPAGSTVTVDAGAPGTVVWGNLTVVNPAGKGYTTVYPCDQNRPVVSTNNYVQGRTVANFTAVKTDAKGRFCIYTSSTAQLLWDQVAETSTVSAGRPLRIVDTRGTAGTAPRPKAGVIAVVDAGAPGRTLFGNLTAVNPAGNGWAVAYPCADGRPGTSNVNFPAGETVPNFVAVKADQAGKVCLYANQDTHLLFDRVATSDSIPLDTPTRLLDTRTGATPTAGTTLRLHVGGSTLLGNLTAVNPAGNGWAVAYPCSDGRPPASNVNFAAGRTTANFVAVTGDPNGDVCLYTSATTGLLLDRSGSVPVPAAHSPARLLDTRDPDQDHWAYLATFHGVGVTWNTCAGNQIGVWASYGTAAGEQDTLKAAIANVASASGLPLVYRGTVNVTPTSANHAGYDLRGGSDLIVSFATPATSDLLPATPAGEPAVGGVGGIRYTQPSSGSARIVYGYALINSDAIAGRSAGYKMSVYAHELGHAVGLGHVADPRQVMNPTVTNASGLWGNGDRTGLASVGPAAICNS